MDVDGERNNPALDGNTAPNRLTNPPGDVGGKLAALLRVEAVDALDQADIAEAHQIFQGEVLARHAQVALGDADDQAQIVAHQRGAGGLAQGRLLLGRGHR